MSPTNDKNPEWLTNLQLAISKNKRDAHNRYFQIATNGRDGWPSVRTVVFRGFGLSSTSLTFITDARSRKKEELLADSRAEICWYFSRTREQFRIRGNLIVSNDQKTIKRAWDNLSKGAREQFFWLPPGLVLGTGNKPVSSEDPPEPFDVLLLSPITIDHLALGKQQKRTVDLLQDGIWHQQPLNP